MVREPRRGQADRERLLTVGQRLFGECGVVDTPLAAILAEADVALGEFSAHFADKHALFHAIFEEFEQDLVDRVTTVSEANPEHDFWVVALAGMQEPTDSKPRVLGIPQGVLDIAFACGPEASDEHTWGDLAEGYALPTKDAILEAFARGYFTDRPAEPLARLLLAAVNAATAVGQRNGEEVDSADMVGTILSVELLGRSLKAPSREQRLLESLWDLNSKRFPENSAGSWAVCEGGRRVQVFGFIQDPEAALRTLLTEIFIPADVDLQCRAVRADYTWTQLSSAWERLHHLSTTDGPVGANIRNVRLSLERNRVQVFVYSSAERAHDELSQYVDMGLIDVCPQIAPPDA